MAQRLLRRMGCEMYEAGRPFSDCRTTDERIGYQRAQEDEAKQGTATNKPK
jgi:hypothetical protein